MERVKRVVSLMLCFVMVFGLLPMSAFAATADETLAASLAEAQTYIDNITVNNSSNDPEKVVKNFGTHFTWDNEKRENSKSYLFDWSYYNGVVFEGIEYLHEVTGEQKYKDYVVEYMSSLIASNGTWAKCSNNSGKECAGYNASHGADCYKTASLLLDAYQMTGDSRYLTIAQKLYADLDTAAANSTYNLSKCGNNFRHTWASDPSPDLWLDGLYMILPFRAEYAKYTNDQEELDLIVSRMQWVSDNMYNSSNGLFYHAADSATSNSGNYWLQAMGWYAAAIVDIMDSMEGSNLEAMKKQLVKFVDGMKRNQNASNGMWKNNVLSAEATKNPYETSGTALTCYAVMKAVNNGWLDESYADMAILAFNGICNEKLNGNTLKDICFKGAPNSGNETFYDNEGKGVGPFIMFYAEVLEYYNNQVVALAVTGPSKTEYELNETLDLTGLTVMGITRGGKTVAVNGYTVSKVDMSVAGNKTVTVTYDGLTATFEIVVTEPEATEPEATEPEVTEPVVTEPVVTEPEVTEPVVTEQTFTAEDAGNELAITATATAATATNVSGEVAAVAGLVNEDYLAYEIALENQVADTAMTVAIELTESFDTEQLVVYYVDAQGAASEVTDFTAATDAEGFQTITVANAKVGTYVYGTRYVEPEEDAKLVSIEIVSAPQQTKYFVEDARAGVLSLDITGMVVKATFSDGTEKELAWNEFDEEADGYSLTFDMTTLGDQDVVVSYAFEGVICTDTFKISVFKKRFATGEANNVVLVPSVPGITEVTANSVAAADVAERVSVLFVAEESKLIAFDINAEGHNEGEPVEITIPIPADVDASRFAVCYVGEDVLEPMNGQPNADGTYTFTTTHFSTYVGGELNNNVSVEGDVVYNTYTLTSNLTEKDTIAANNSVIIGDGTNFIKLNANGTYGVTTDPTEATVWTVGGNSNNFTFTSGNVTLTVNNYSSWRYSSDRGIHYRTGSFMRYTYYHLNYGNSWNVANNVEDEERAFAYDVPTASGTYKFSASPKNITLKTGTTEEITYTVTLNDEEVTFRASDVTWATNNRQIATVANGVVTGVGEGTATITATLNRINGTSFGGTIELTFNVTVQDRSVVSSELSGNGQIEASLNETPNYSNIKYTVTYDDNSTDEFTVGNGLTVGVCDTSTSGRKTVDILYNGTKVGEVVVKVTVDFNKLPVADMDKAPQYPNDGAVRIDKTATHNAEEFNRTGVTHVELDVAGITVKQGVDVVLIVDVSNSMGWSLENAGNSSDSDRIADDGQITKLEHAMNAASDFADVLLEGNNGSVSDNTLSFVTFAGYDKTFGVDPNDTSKNLADSLMEVFRQVDDVDAAKVSFKGTKFTANNSNYPLQIMNEKGTVVTSGNNRGDTNYDYAFWQAMQTVNAIKADNVANNQGTREVYIVFMTDGAPSHYNHLVKNGTSARKDAFPYDGDTASGYYNGKNNDYQSNQDDWYGFFSGEANTYARTLYDAVNGNFYAIGFDLAHGGFSGWQWTEAQLKTALEGLAYHDDAVRKIPVSATANASDLAKIYADLAMKFRPAGTEAVVHDTVGNNFSVQMLPYVLDNHGNQITLATPPSITVKTYDLYPRGTMIDGEDVTGHRTGVSTDIETVTFAEVNGKLEAYSKVIGEGINILTEGADGSITINAKYFTYTKTATSKETFVWNIGNITDKEIALRFDAYLEGSMSGQRPEDVYYTNEEAILEYVDINGQYAKQTFPIPGVMWGGASTTIRFYLVNEKGEPVNRDGKVVPWANRVYVGDSVPISLNLNGDLTIEAQKVEAAAHVPAGFFLYDNNAYYTVQTTSSDEAIVGGITVSEPSDDAFKTTGTGTDVVKQTGAQTTKVISHEDPYYTWSYVGFGVRWDLTAEKTEYVLTSDQVVIDYGKAIQVDVLANDVTRAETYDRELIGFIKYTPGTDLSFVMENAGANSYTADYGIFTITADQTVQFQPTKMLDNVQRVFYAVQYTNLKNEDDSYIVWGQLNVIPATIMYYETDFATGVFSYTGWGTAKTDGTTADGPQNDGTIGQNTYGYDSSYNNDAYLSNGKSEFANGAGFTTTTASFSFTGTGFDIISRTGAQQGQIKVQIYTDAAMKNLHKSVAVLNKSESGLELYQIPVVSVNGLTYGTYYVKIGVDIEFENETGIPALDALNRGNEFYFDAIRIYDPAKGNAVAEAAYAADGEANNQLDEVRALLLDAATYAEIEGQTTGMVFIDRTQVDVEISTYATIGPNNEVYLSKGQAVAFKVKADSIPASFDIGAKSITGSTAGLKVTIVKNDGSTIAWTDTATIASSTVQFIDLLDATGADATLLYRGAYVIITNTADGVLSITDLKVAYGAAASAVSEDEEYGIDMASFDPEDSYSVAYSVDSTTFAVARNVMMFSAAPETPEEPEETIPEETVPEETVPETTVPETTVPEETEPEVTEPDNTQLKAAVEAAKKLKEKDYTKESFKAVQDARKAAEKVLKNKKATQVQIDTALEDLNEAMESLEAESRKGNKPGKDEKPGKGEKREQSEADTSAYDILDASVKAGGNKKNRKYTITVVTSREVEDIEIAQNGKELKAEKISHKDDKKKDTREWTIVLSAGVSNKVDIFTLTGVGKDGTQGGAVNVAKPN